MEDLEAGNNGFETRLIEEQVPHPDFTGDHPNFDLMLVKLTESSRTVTQFLAVNADKGLPANEGDDLTLIGFAFGSTNPLLQEVLIKYIPNDACSTLSEGPVDLEGAVTPQWLCANDVDKGVCSGDGGGPLIVKGTSADLDVHVGIASTYVLSID
jgi:secreted trypsin-like serine protease